MHIDTSNVASRVACKDIGSHDVAIDNVNLARRVQLSR